MAFSGGVSPSIADVLAGRERWAMGLCDGFALARWLGPGAVHHVIGDPPYNDRTHDNARTTDEQGQAIDMEIDFAPLPPTETFLPGLLSCSRRWVILFCALEQLGDYERAGGASFLRSGLWVRTNGMPQRSGDRPAQGGEGIAILHGSAKPRWNRHGDQGTWTGPRAEARKGRHPTKKPLWLMEALIRDFTDPGDVVLDPCAGEGTTGEACLRLGRRFVGCEILPKYHAMAVDRLTRAAARGVQQELVPATGPKAKQLGLAPRSP